jgi:hypothetical protein
MAKEKICTQSNLLPNKDILAKTIYRIISYSIFGRTAYNILICLEELFQLFFVLGLSFELKPLKDFFISNISSYEITVNKIIYVLTAFVGLYFVIFLSSLYIYLDMKNRTSG